MGEPKKRVETITYQYDNGRTVSVRVRKNRTEAETNVQLVRMYNTYGPSNRMTRAMNTHAYTRKALSLTGRGKPIANSLPATLIGRK